MMMVLSRFMMTGTSLLLIKHRLVKSHLSYASLEAPIQYELVM